MPDVAISQRGPVPVDIEASGIPDGTRVTLEVYPQTPEDITMISFPPLEATLREMRPIQLWVPDVRSPAFLREARRQSRVVSLADRNEQSFLDANSEWPRA